MINFYQLQTFLTVVSEGSMTAAADKLYLTQPAISQQIRALEESLGVELLVRGVRQIKPTLQGEVLLENAKKILQMVQQAEIAVSMLNRKIEGELRVGSINSVGLHLMTGVLSRFLRLNSSIKMKLEYGRIDDLVKSFRKGQLDVLITPDLEKEFGVKIDGMEKRLIQHEELWLVATGKDLDCPKEISIKDIDKRAWVHFFGEYHQFDKDFETKIRENNVKLNAVFESSNVGTIKRVVESGLGWGFLPSHSIRKQVKLGRMNKILVNDFNYKVDICFFSDAQAKQKDLIDFLFQSVSPQDRS
jgi:DNA-binding transcriptional LysR family regulator